MRAKLKQLAKDSFVYGISNTLGKFIGIFLIPLYTRVFLPEEYGIIDLVTISITMMLIFITCGFDSAIFKFSYDEDTKEKQQEVISTIFVTLFIIALFVTALISLLHQDIAVWMFGTASHTESIILLAGFCLPFEILSAFVYRVLRLRFMAKTYAILSIANLLFTIGLTVLLIVGFKTGMIGIFIARLISNIVQSFMGLIIVKNDLTFHFNFNRLKDFFTFGLPLVPAGLSQWMLNFINRYILLIFCALSQVGIYSLGAKIASVLMILTGAFQLAWGPFALSIARNPDAPKIYAKVLDYFFLVAVLAAALLTMFSREIVLMISTEQYVAAADLVGLLASGIIAMGIFYIFTIGATIGKKTKFITYAIVLGTIVNIITSVLLIPQFNIVGAAVGTFAGYVVAACFMYYFSQKVFYIPYKIGKQIFMSILYTLLVILLLNHSPNLNFLSYFLWGTFILLLFKIYLNTEEKQEIVRWLTLKRGILH